MKVLFTRDDNSDENDARLPYDKNLFVVFIPVKNQAVSFSELGELADGTQSFTMPNSF